MKKLLAKIFDTYPSESSSYKAIFFDLDRRGKLDFKHVTQVVLMLIEEVEALQGRVAQLESTLLEAQKKTKK